MKIILTQDVDKLGRAGDVVTVKEGYARNFLLPSNKARAATPGNMKLLDVQKKKQASDDERVVEAARALANRLANLSLTISAEAGEEDKGLCGRDAAAPAGRAPYDMGTDARGHRHHAYMR